MMHMSFGADVRQKIAEELERGAAARAAGLEGRARVCARRAAGAAIRAYLEERGAGQGLSAHDLLATLADEPGLAGVPEQARRSAALLLERVDENYALPPGIDLLVEARSLVEALENQGTE